MVEGKPGGAGSVKTFSCPGCGGTITIRAVGISITAVCQSCGGIVDVANDNVQRIAKATAKVRKTTIPLGTRGMLMGTVWEVIGYTDFTDESGKYHWHEYLLFNPYQGFRFLVESDGHWNFVKMLRQHITGAGTADGVWLDREHYHIYTRGRAIVQYVMGEFYWRVKIEDESRVADYVHAPYMLSMEESGGDVIWSLGTYVDRDEIRHAFIPDAAMPRAIGISPNQPSPYGNRMKALMMPMLMYFVALIVMQMIASHYATSQVIYERDMHVDPIYRNQPVVADDIDVPAGTGNLKILSHSAVNNDWVELSVSLVNSTTQEADDFTQAIEYYYGYDSDGRWSEGSHATSNILSAVPGGKYRLLIEPDAGAFRRFQPIDFQVWVIRNVPMRENFWVSLLLLMAYPMYVLIRRWSFETQRWSNSDYAPGIYRRDQ